MEFCSCPGSKSQRQHERRLGKGGKTNSKASAEAPVALSVGPPSRHPQISVVLDSTKALDSVTRGAAPASGNRWAPSGTLTATVLRGGGEGLPARRNAWHGQYCCSSLPAGSCVLEGSCSSSLLNGPANTTQCAMDPCGRGVWSPEESRGLWGICRRTLTRSPVPIPIIALVVSVGDCGARRIAGSVPTSVRAEGAQGHPEAQVEQCPNKRSTYVNEGFIQRAGP